MKPTMGIWVRTVTVTVGTGPSDSDAVICLVRPRDGAGEQIPGPVSPVSRGPVRERTVPGSGAGRIDHRVAHMNDQSELQDSGEDHRQQRHHHDGFCDGGSLVVSQWWEHQLWIRAKPG